MSFEDIRIGGGVATIQVRAGGAHGERLEDGPYSRSGDRSVESKRVSQKEILLHDRILDQKRAPHMGQ